MNNKQNRIKFVKEIKKIIVEFNPTIEEKWNDDPDFQRVIYKIPIGDNNFTLTVYSESNQKNMFCVDCRFDKLVVGLGNQHSYKHNFLTTSPVNDAVVEFKNFIDRALETTQKQYNIC